MDDLNPTDEQLLAFVFGAGDPAEAEAVRAQLVASENCRRRYDAFVDAAIDVCLEDSAFPTSAFRSHTVKPAVAETIPVTKREKKEKTPLSPRTRKLLGQGGLLAGIAVALCLLIFGWPFGGGATRAEPLTAVPTVENYETDPVRLGVTPVSYFEQAKQLDPITKPSGNPELAKIYDWIVSLKTPTDEAVKTATQMSAPPEYLSDRYLQKDGTKVSRTSLFTQTLGVNPSILPGLIVPYEQLVTNDKNIQAIEDIKREAFDYHVLGVVPKESETKLSFSYDPTELDSAGKVRSLQTQVREDVKWLMSHADEMRAPLGATVIIEEAHSKEHLQDILQASANWTGGSVSFNFEKNQDIERASIFMVAIQRDFTWHFEPRTDLAKMFAAGTTLEKLKRHFGKGNPPCMVTDVTYGKVYMLEVRSNKSSKTLKAALRAKYSAMTAGGSVSLSREEEEALRNATCRLFAYGGKQSGWADVITLDPTEALTRFKNFVAQRDTFTADGPPVPIAYRAVFLKDYRPAAVKHEYDLFLRRSTPYKVRLRVEEIRINNDHDGFGRGKGEFWGEFRIDDTAVANVDFKSGGKTSHPNAVDTIAGSAGPNFKFALKLGEEDDQSEKNWDRAGHLDGLIQGEWTFDVRELKDAKVITQSGGGNHVRFSLQHVPK